MGTGGLLSAAAALSRMVGAGALLCALIAAGGFAAREVSAEPATVVPSAARLGPWLTCPPERLPKVTVRWEDADQREVFVVEGERYQCRVATWPARVLSLRVDGKDLLGPGGVELAFLDAEGKRYRPAPQAMTPAKWTVWRRKWAPGQDSRGRMNVWNATPYYWEAHLLDIPFVSGEQLQAAAATTGRVLAEWAFEDGAQGWEALHNCELAHGEGGTARVTTTGEDPYLQSPAVNAPAPLAVAFRMRTTDGGGAALYWADERGGYSGERVEIFGVNGDGEWHEYSLPLDVQGALKQLRFDPPGESGAVELDWVRLIERPKEDPNVPAPVRGEVIFHTYADQLRIELRFEPPEGGPTPKTAVLSADAALGEQSLAGGRPLATLGTGGATAGLLGCTGTTFEAATKQWTAPLTGDRPGTYWVLRPVTPGAALQPEFVNDLEPLPADAVTVTNGHWLGYDAPSGLYRMQSVMQGGGYSFNSAFDNPNRRMAMQVAIRPGAQPRRLLVKCASQSGILPSTVLTDLHGFMLPTPVLSCKNFGGELEEPDDSGYGDAYFPVGVNANEEISFQVVHSFQRWGDHLLKQVTSIRFFNIYWHLSTGVSETTCFTIPWMLLNGEYVLIPDFRPYSGPFWPGQPQHDCQSWPGLLQYRAGGERVRCLYERTVFQSITPNLARFTMHYTTSDGAARVSMTAMEIPQSDETRTFLRLRYDWDKLVTIDGDARQSFRWLNMNDKRVPRLLVWLDAAGKTQTKPAAANTQLLLGEPLAKEFPFVGTHGIGPNQGFDDYSAFVLVRSFRAKLGGKDYDAPVVSSAYGDRTGNYWLTSPTEQLQLQPGDFVEAEVMLMPHAEPVEPTLKPERERLRFGTEGPKVEQVTIGRKVADFPATVEAQDEVAQFTLSGGHDALPVIVKGFRHWNVPLLWDGALWLNQQCHGGDGYQVNADGDGSYRLTFVVPLRHGMSPNLMVTRAECTTDIARVRDLNGYPCLESDTDGRFALKAPVLFAPGRNELESGSPVVTFTGTGRQVRAVPVSVDAKDGKATVDLESYAEDTCTLKVSGKAQVAFNQLATGATYEVSVNAKATQQVAANGRLTVEAPGPETAVRLRRVGR
jgi:hypothetical protein